jgi:hypothetical protein
MHTLYDNLGIKLNVLTLVAYSLYIGLEASGVKSINQRQFKAQPHKPQMPYNCSICGSFLARSIKELFRHIGARHRNDPNFHCLCGINGCTLTFRKYFTWRKHIKRIHTNVENIDDVNTEEAGDANAFNNNDLPDDAGHQQLGDQIPRNQIKKSGALYLLNLQEVCRLPKATVDSVVANTRTIIEEVVSNLQGQVEKCLQDNDIDVHAVTGLENLLSTVSNLISLKGSTRYSLRSSNTMLLSVPSGKSLKTLGDRAFCMAAPALWIQHFAISY